MVREFEEEAATTVAVVVGGADAGDPPDSAFEVAVAAAGSIGLYALSTGHPVHAYRWDQGTVERVVRPERVELLDWLASVYPSEAPVARLAAEAAEDVGRRGSVVICTTHLGPVSDLQDAVRAVQSAGARALPVLVDTSGWRPDGEGADLDVPADARTRIRVLQRGDGLAQCLQG